MLSRRAALVEGLWSPIWPLLIRSDVRDDTAWRDGLAGRFLDDTGELCLGWEYYVLRAYAANRDLVGDGEITSVFNLLDPKWTSRIIMGDPRVGLGLQSAAAVAHAHGQAVLKQLLVEQRPTITGDSRRLAEGLVIGQYSVALGLRPKALAPFLEHGLGNNIAFLDLPDADYASSTSMLYFDRAPHPAAAQLFANWILTQTGQSLLTSSLPTNSARTDVDPFQPDGIASRGHAYFEPDKQANHAHTAATQRFVKTLLS